MSHGVWQPSRLAARVAGIAAAPIRRRGRGRLTMLGGTGQAPPNRARRDHRAETIEARDRDAACDRDRPWSIGSCPPRDDDHRDRQSHPQRRTDDRHAVLGSADVRQREPDEREPGVRCDDERDRDDRQRRTEAIANDRHSPRKANQRTPTPTVIFVTIGTAHSAGWRIPRTIAAAITSVTLPTSAGPRTHDTPNGVASATMPAPIPTKAQRPSRYPMQVKSSVVQPMMNSGHPIGWNTATSCASGGGYT